VRFSLGADRSESLTTLTQGTTKVVDETYGTPTSDYTRYISIHTDQKSTSGKTLDFSTILGQWAKSDSSAASGGSSVVLLPQAVLGTGLPLGGLALPIANLTPHLRGQLIEQIRDQNVYQISFNKVQKAHQNGRLVYTYDASIQPILYASMMKNFGKVVGLHNFDQLDPNNYSGQPALKVKLTIDVRAHHLVSIVAADGAIKQKYSGYDIPLTMPPPTHTITATQLQQRLTQLQK